MNQHLVTAMASLLLFTAQTLADDSVIPLGSRRELFTDRFLLESTNNVELQLQHPQDAGVTLKFDQPWEGSFSGYVTVIRDGDLLRLYYRGNASTNPRDGNNEESTCYAESTDGIHWTRPQWTKFPVPGSPQTNIMLSGVAPFTHNFCPFLDTNPNCKPTERFKGIGGTEKTGLFLFTSADGVNWQKAGTAPLINDTGWVFDSQNVMFWSAAENCYVAYYRKVPPGTKIRAIARTSSPDLVTWTPPDQMQYSNTGTTVPRHHLYTSQTHPYFRAPHLYLSTAARFMPGRRVLSDEQAEEIGVHKKYFGDTSDAVLMTSRGGTLYDCTFEEGFLRPGLGYSNWVSRTNYPALNIVQTSPTEMSLYVNQDYGQPTAHLHRYTLRLDGLASLHAGVKTGTVITKPFTFSGSELALNFSTSAAGGIKVEIQDADGKPIPGFTLADSVELIGNELGRTATWKTTGANLSQFAGKPIKLLFQLTDADLFAMQFSDSPKQALKP